MDMKSITAYLLRFLEERGIIGNQVSSLKNYLLEGLALSRGYL